METARSQPELPLHEPSSNPESLKELGTEEVPGSKSMISRLANRVRPARQLLLEWSSAMLTLVFLVLTAVYASETTVPYRVRFLYASSSNTIFTLSALSALAGLFLAATIAAAFERLQWLLVARARGLKFTKVLSLNAATGVTGLLQLTAWRGHPLLTTTRLWSATRLISIMLVPILGILIMSESSV